MYTPTQLKMEVHTFDNFSFPGEDFAGAHPMLHRGSTASSVSTMIPLAAGSSYSTYPTAGGENLFSPASIAGQGPVVSDSMMYQAGVMMESPTLWDNGIDFLESHRSSPIMFEDAWAIPAAQLATSAANSPFQHPASIEGISPRYVQDTPDLLDLPPYTTTGDRVTRKPIGPRPSKVASDLAARPQRLSGTSENSEESFRLARSNAEVDNTARDHHLYHNVTPQADGLYHCPWENDPASNCQHKPEKLKCNYEYDTVPSSALVG